MIQHPYFVAGFFLVAIAGLMATADRPLDLFSDVGVDRDDACAVIERDGAGAIQRLDASGFPHATDAAYEVYRLTRTGTIEAAIALDWQNQNAYCIPLDTAQPYTVSFDTNEAGYRALVEELTSVVETGALSDHKVANGVDILTWTSVTAPDGSHDYSYRFQLATWAAGKVARGGGA